MRHNYKNNNVYRLPVLNEGYFKDADTEDDILSVEAGAEASWGFIASITYSAEYREVPQIMDHAEKTGLFLKCALETSKFVTGTAKEHIMTLPGIEPDFNTKVQIIINDTVTIWSNEKMQDPRYVEKLFFDQHYLSISIPFNISNGQITAKELCLFCQSILKIQKKVYEPKKLMVQILNCETGQSVVIDHNYHYQIVSIWRAVKTLHMDDMFDCPDADSDLFKQFKYMRLHEKDIIDTFYAIIQSDTDVFRMLEKDIVPVAEINALLRKEKAHFETRDLFDERQFAKDYFMKPTGPVGNFLNSTNGYYVFIICGYYGFQVHFIPKQEYLKDDRDYGGILHRIRCLVYHQTVVSREGIELLMKLGISLEFLSDMAKGRNIFIKEVIEKICKKMREIQQQQ